MSNDLHLRVFARVESPSPEMFEYLSVKEGVSSPLECWVDLATPRDFEWSDEIREKTVEFGVADEEGEVLATFETLAEAEQARSKARVKLSLILEEDEAEAKPQRGAAIAGEGKSVDEFLSTARA